MKVNKLIYGFSVLGLLATASCGGASSSSTGGGATAADLRSLSNIPELDVDSLDVAGSADASLSRSLTRGFGEVGSFSRAGCEMRSMVSEIAAQVEQVASEQCIIAFMDENTAMEVGDGAYNYYEISFGEGDPDEDGPAGENVLVKIGVINDELRLYTCGVVDDVATQDGYSHYTVSGGNFVGNIKGIYDNGESGLSSNSLDVVLPEGSLEDYAEGDEATIDGQFDSGWGSGRIAFSAGNVDGTLKNTVNASFNNGGEDSEWGNWVTKAYGESDATDGCAQFSSTGEYPAMVAGQVLASEDVDASGFESEDSICWVEFNEETDFASLEWPTDFIQAANEDGKCEFGNAGTECFSYSLAEDDSLLSLIADEADVAYADDVTGFDLGDLEAPSIAFEGEEIWDCTAPDGFTVIDASAVANTVMEACPEPNMERDSNPCFDQESEQHVEDEGHELLPPGEEGGDEIDPTNYLAICTEETIEDDCSGLGENKVCGGDGDSLHCTILCSTDADCDVFDGLDEENPEVSCVNIGGPSVCIFGGE